MKLFLIKLFFKEVKKHMRIYGLFIKNCAMQQMEYRANFLIHIVVECIYVASKLLYVMIAYQAGSEISGLTAEQITLFIGTFMILTAVYTGLFMDNFYGISNKVKKGELDMMMVKPVSLQFYTSMRGVNLALPVPNLLVGGAMVCTSWSRMGIRVSAGNILLYIALLVCGIVLTYSIFLFPQLLAFWTVQTGAIVEMTDKLWDFNNMPMKIYGRWIQRIGTFVIPVFCITNFPVMSVLGSLSPVQKIWAAAAPAAFAVLVRIAWKGSVRHYSSAGG
ncbi:MAG: ABC-2 family transporter protein [Clostridium sp.]|jgi:ABC-2 type transport system permease protein|nr:ABC-2 family transporter protein [Clostridium sp.]